MHIFGFLRRRRPTGKAKVVTRICEHAIVRQELDAMGIPDCTDWACSKDGKCPYLWDFSVFCPQRDMDLREELGA